MAGGLRAAALAGVLVGIAAGGWGRASEAHAAAASRGDPMFLIGPGAIPTPSDDKLQLTVSVDGQATGIAYEIHGPAGTAVHSVVYTGGKLSGLESYTFVDDQPPGQYLVVTTASAPLTVPVTAGEQAVTAAGSSPAPVSASGQSNQGITTVVVGTTAVSATDGQPTSNTEDQQ